MTGAGLPTAGPSIQHQSTAQPARPGISRRQVLKWAGIGGGAIVVLGGAGVAIRAYDQGVFSVGDGAAYEAWDSWNEGTPPMSLVRAALLAASAHNTQPWLFRIAQDRIDLYADIGRNTGALDALRREMYVSLGCALENLCVAAAAAGLTPAVTLLPEADNAAVASVALAAGPVRDTDLYQAIPNRHTNRHSFKPSEVNVDTLQQLSGLNSESELQLLWLTSTSDKRQFSDLTIAATEAFIADREQSEASHAWFRSDWDAVQHNKDGLTLDTAGLSGFTTVLAKILPATSMGQANESFLSSTRDTHLPTAAAFGLIVAADRNDRRSQLLAGRLYQRTHLAATDLGLAMQPLNQVVERADREKQLGIAATFGDSLAQLTPDGLQTIMPFRIGYPKDNANRSPRRPAEEVLG